MRKSIFIFWLFATACLYQARTSNDTLQSWWSKFYKIGNIEYSRDGKWAAVKKWYDYNTDTTMIFNTQKDNALIGTVIKMRQNLSFLKNDALIAYDIDKAEFWNLKNNLRIHYDNVKKANALVDVNRYCILEKNGILTVYNNDGSKLNRTADVQNIHVTDGKRKLYAVRKNQKLYEIQDLSTSQIKTLYSTTNEIGKLELSPSGYHLIFTESIEETKKIQITFINTLTGKVQHPKADYPSEAEMSTTEIQGGKAYLISFGKRTKPIDKQIVDIWYGNSSNLREKKYGSVEYEYWLWMPDQGRILTVPNDKFTRVTSLNSTRYLLAFNPSAEYNYLTQEPQLKTYVYDIQKKIFSEFAALKGVHYGSPEIICSLNGNYLLGSEDGEKWTLFDLETMGKQLIEHKGLQNPNFTRDNKQIFFESDNDLWTFNIKNRNLKSLGIASGKMTKIINYEKSPISSGFNFSINSLDSQRPILIKIWEKDTNRTSYINWKNGHVQNIVASTLNNVKEVKFDEGIEKLCVIEENYNLSSKIFFINSKKQSKQMLFGGTIHDKEAVSLQQEIISYTNSTGQSLKGLLYYPTRYNPLKRYPMIVRIYQIQSDTSNEYHVPGYINPVGFDLRTLLEKGYFVYLPDIVFDSSGTGLSALDCVNNALDAISSKQGINMEKIGLIGHSHGGYETNFIATHSNRFAAYISGAGNSDIIRSYFSYNYNFTSPFYWQYENGQYQMKVPFAENKDLYFKNNPIHNVEKVAAPILLWAGKKDENIAWDQTMEFYVGLKRNQKPVVTLFYPNQGHSLGSNSEERKDLYKRVLQWWDYFLKDKREVLWINQQYKMGAY